MSLIKNNCTKSKWFILSREPTAYPLPSRIFKKDLFQMVQNVYKQVARALGLKIHALRR